MIAFSFNLTQPRITWAESLNKGLSTLGWPTGVQVGIVLIKLIDVGRPRPLCIAPLPGKEGPEL